MINRRDFFLSSAATAGAAAFQFFPHDLFAGETRKSATDRVQLGPMKVEVSRLAQGSGTNGVRFLSGATLHVHKTQIRGFRQSGGGGNGILIDPSTGIRKIFVADSYITDNGSLVGNAAMLIKPTAGASVNVNVNNTQMEANSNGIFMDGSGGAGASNLTVKNSVLSGSTNNGIAVSSTGGVFRALVSGTTMHASSVGAAVAGGSATLRLGDNTIAQNVTGVSASGGGILQSFKNNMIGGNVTDGTPITAVPGGPLN